MNKTRDSYSANVTIFNCLKNHDIEGPWKLGWTWSESEILLSTVGAEGTQQGNDLVGEYTRPKNRVSVVDLPPQTKAKYKVANCCKGGMISSWYKEADLAKSSSSFQITVGRVNTRYHRPPYLVRFTSPRSEYICYSMWETDETPGYLCKFIDLLAHNLCLI